MKRKAVFLDRDGTLVEAIERPEFEKKVTAPFRESELVFVPGVKETLKLFRDLGYLRIMITNQPDVAYGYLSEEEWERIHNRVISELNPDDWFICRHRRGGGCPMKKPSPMMILAAADTWNIDLKSSFMIGDTDNDTLAAKAAGCRSILISTSYNAGTEADFVVPSFLHTGALIKGLST